MVTNLQNNQDVSIYKMDVDDVESVGRMQMQLWIETYVNKEFGVTEEWVRSRWENRLKPEIILERKRKLAEDQKSAGKESFVAKNKEGKVIGVIGYSRDENDRQELGMIYVEKSYHGKGVADILMDKIIEWADPQKDIYVGVVVYNNRAKAFYEKWGFREIEGSDKLFDGKLPEIMMARKGVK